MAKKTFKGGIDTLLGDEQAQTTQNDTKPAYKKRGAQKRQHTRVITKTSQENCKDDETRATFIVKEDSLAKVKAIAYWQRIPIKDVVNNALTNFLDDYEKEYGAINTDTDGSK